MSARDAAASKPSYGYIAQISRLAKQISKRDSAMHTLQGDWFETGRDLAELKTLVKHGEFDAWCKRELSYSKSKVQKLMRAHKEFAQHVKSVTVTHFPPPTVAYKLSAPSMPADIKAEFIPKVLTGEDVGLDLTKALKAHRKRHTGESAANAPAVDAEPERQQFEEARMRAFHLLIGSLIEADLIDLLEFAANAGPNGVFGDDLASRLEDHVRSLDPK